MMLDLRLRAEVFFQLADALDSPDGDPAQAGRLRRLGDELLRQAAQREQADAAATEKKRSTH